MTEISFRFSKLLALWLTKKATTATVISFFTRSLRFLIALWGRGKL
jgi:hypothetical protein